MWLRYKVNGTILHNLKKKIREAKEISNTFEYIESIKNKMKFRVKLIPNNLSLFAIL